MEAVIFGVVFTTLYLVVGLRNNILEIKDTIKEIKKDIKEIKDSL